MMWVSSAFYLSCCLYTDTQAGLNNNDTVDGTSVNTLNQKCVTKYEN